MRINFDDVSKRIFAMAQPRLVGGLPRPSEDADARSGVPTDGSFILHPGQLELANATLAQSVQIIAGNKVIDYPTE